MKKLSLPFIAFLQALGLVLYCSLVGMIFAHGNEWFGPPVGFWGPALVLVLLVVSVLICGLIGLGHAFRLFWIEKKPEKALRLVGYTTIWSTFFFLSFLLSLVIFL